jgi:glycosyltransferase involved in cell wall biosynthesis
MKVSIITVCFNSEKTIEDTIKSVLNQTYIDIEYIIIDGGSHDSTINVIKSFESQFNKRLIWISERDNGLYDAMNKGIKLATGEVIALLNSDDLLCDEQALEKVVDVFTHNPKLDSVHADLYYVAQNDTNKIVRKWRTGKQRLFKRGWHPAHPTLYIKKRVYEKYGLFNLDFKLASDFELMLRFFEKDRISSFYIPESFVKMRLGGETNKSFRNIYQQNLECLRAFKINKINVNKWLYPFYRVLPKLFQF